MGVFGRKKETSAAAEAAAAAATSRTAGNWRPPPKQYVELGSIDYVNLTHDGRHGDFQKALDAAAVTGKPIFANFVEWSG